MKNHTSKRSFKKECVGFDSIFFSLGETTLKARFYLRRCRRDEEGTGARRRPEATTIITTTTRRTRETRRMRGGDPREEKNNENAIIGR